METSIQHCMKIISEARKRTPTNLSPPFKEKEKGGEGRSMFGGQWKVPCLVANGRFHVWWPMEGSKLGGQWKVPCLVANGMFQAWWPMECSKLGGQWNVPSLVANGM
jgi:glutaredoxin